MRSKPAVPIKIKRLVEKTESHIVSVMGSCNSPIKEAGTSIVKAGGKRLRPLMVLLSAWPSRDASKLIKAAASVELLHIGSLVHDDLIDHAKTRRGVPAIHESFGGTIAVSTGDNLFAQAFFSLASCDNHDAVKVLCDAVNSMSDGQLQEFNFKQDKISDPAQYLKMIYGKTAALFEASLGIGSLISDNNSGQCRHLMDYGKNLGMAFQLVDDLIDITGDAVVVGKPVGNDLRENTLTLPVMLAFDMGLDRNIVASISVESDQEQVIRAISSIKKTGAVDKVYGMVVDYTAKAKQNALEANCVMSPKLIEIADYLKTRIN